MPLRTKTNLKMNSYLTKAMTAQPESVDEELKRNQLENLLSTQTITLDSTRVQCFEIRTERNVNWRHLRFWLKL